MSSSRRPSVKRALSRVFYDPIDYLATPLINDKQVSLGRGQKCWRWTLVIMSVAFIVCGSISIWWGAQALQRATSSDSRGTHRMYVPIGLIVTGSFMVLFCLFGIYGAIRESSKALWVYLICATLTAIAMLVVAVLILTATGPNVGDNWQTRWSDEFKQNIQTRDNCCGLYEYNDQYKVGTCPVTATTACATVITSHIQHVFNTAGAVAVGLSAVMASTLISTLVLAIAFRRKHTYGRINDTRDSGDLELENNGISSLSMHDRGESGETFVRKGETGGTFVVGVDDRDEEHYDMK